MASATRHAEDAQVVHFRAGQVVGQLDSAAESEELAGGPVLLESAEPDRFNLDRESGKIDVGGAGKLQYSAGELHMALAVHLQSVQPEDRPGETGDQRLQRPRDRNPRFHLAGL